MLGLVRALATEPAFVLLDEPAAGLSELESDSLAAVLLALRDTFEPGMLVVEHDMRLIMGLAERIQVLDHGVTIAIGTPEQIRGDAAVRTAYLGHERSAGARTP
jgi:branched-chain amino acid transport system ATP-binding protein